MTVETNDTIDRLVISGTGPYTFSFRIFDESELAVTVDTGGLDSVVLEINSDYTVPTESINGEGGGYIYLTSGAAAMYAGDMLDIRSNTIEDQPTSITNQGAFLPTVHEDAFDRLARQVQDVNRRVDLKFGYPDTVTTAAGMVTRAAWAGRYVYVSPLGIIEPASAIALTTLTQSVIAQLLIPQTQAEIDAGVTPVNYAYEPGDVRRYGAVGDGVTVCTTAIQNALNSNRKVTFPAGVFVTGALTLPDWTTMEGQGYTPGIGGSNRVTELRFSMTGAGAAITCGDEPVLRNILFQNYGGTYSDVTGTLSGTATPCILLGSAATITECSFYTWYQCIVMPGTYYLKTSRVHFNRCTYGYYGTTTSSYNIDIHQPQASLTEIFIAGASSGVATRNVKVFGGSIELYSVVAVNIIDIAFFGTYFETGSPRTGVFAIDPQVNGCSVSLFGCVVYMDATARFVNMSALTNSTLTGAGNVFDGAGAASAICYLLPSTGAVSLSGDRFGTGHDNATLYVDAISNAVKFNCIHMPLLPAANSQFGYSEQLLIGQKGYLSLGLTAAPSSPVTGLTVMADGVSWDPLSRAAGRTYWVLWQGDRWRSTDGEEIVWPTATTTALTAIGNAINTTGKIAGKTVRNTTSNKLVIAQGTGAGDTWISVDGVTTHTPV